MLLVSEHGEARAISVPSALKRDVDVAERASDVSGDGPLPRLPQSTGQASLPGPGASSPGLEGDCLTSAVFLPNVR